LVARVAVASFAAASRAAFATSEKLSLRLEVDEVTKPGYASMPGARLVGFSLRLHVRRPHL